MATIDELNLTPYQRIMAQMTPTVNPYMGAGQIMGGYDPSFQGGYDPGLYSRLTRSGLINTGGMGGGGGGGGSDYSDSNPAWSNMTDAEKAAYYAANPTMATITQLGQKAFGLTSLGALQRAMNPGFVSDQSLIAMGINPAAYQAAKESFRASEIAAMNAGYPSAIDQNAQAMQSMQDAYNADMAAAQAAAAAAQNAQSMQSMQDALAADTAAAQGQSISDQSSAGASDAGTGYGTGDTSGGFGEGQYNMGGLVDRVGGPNPAGPDDGAGMLQLGEYVIKKSAVKKYGKGLLDMINDGKIPAKKMKSLLG